MLQAVERLVPAEEPEAGQILGEAFAEEGIDVQTEVKLERVEPVGDGVRVHLAGRTAVEGERLLMATGRTANLDGFEGIERRPNGFLQVDPATLSAGEGMFGGGDVIGGAFTHVAHYHGTLIGKRLNGAAVMPATPVIPRVTFTDPEIGSVRPTEAQARERGIDVAVATADVAQTARGYIHDAKRGTIKLVADRVRRVLVGATVVSPRAGEILSELTLAVRAEVPLEVLDDTLQAFPTFSRVLQGVFADLAL